MNCDENGYSRTDAQLARAMGLTATEVMKGSVETRLKPCPLCGGAAKEHDRFNSNTVTCRGCGVKVKQSGMGMGDAADRWNRRATQLSVPDRNEIIELLATLLHFIPKDEEPEIYRDTERLCAALRGTTPPADTRTQQGRNTGHGHVFPRPDGIKARCGGPAFCAECGRDFVRAFKGKAHV